ncbi:MAG: alpha/beta fold hydrolase [Bacteroidales bacterium]|nr:alpha/beta fold hydrolase [Bacteroidales bacterium]MCF8327054.1 alpha/beta fold hydrolase [Bacteroidales bacterium]
MNTIHYEIKGSGPAMVLLHGFMESLEIWYPFLPSLCKDFSVVMIDLPGHGKSLNPEKDHSLEFIADKIKEILDKEGIKKCTMIGHSMGGYVALAFAKAYSQSLNGIALFHSHPDEDTENARKNRERTINIVKNDKAGFIREFIPSLYAEKNKQRLKPQIDRQKEIAKQMDAEGIVAALQGMKERKASVDFIQSTQLPVLFIVGKQDSRIQLKRMQELIMMPAHAEALILDGVGHMGFHEAEFACVTTLHTFAQKCFGV